jgi:hypothetical protein
VAEARGQFGDPEEGERSPLEELVRAVVNYRVCELAIAL